MINIHDKLTRALESTARTHGGQMVQIVEGNYVVHRDHDPCDNGCGKLLVQYAGGQKRKHLRCPGPPVVVELKRSKSKSKKKR